MKRIETLRKQILDGVHLSDEFRYLFYKKYTCLTDLSEEERYGESFYYAFSRMTPSISDGELIVGKRDIPLSGDALEEWHTLEPLATLRIQQAGGGQDSHMAVDYELLLSVGISGIIDRIDTYLADCAPEKTAFYQCAKRCLQGVLVYAEKYVELAERLAQDTADTARRAELQTIADICRRVPAHPATTFYEAVQSVHFLTHCLSCNPLRPGIQQFQLGHPDRYLLPFYETDIQNGSLTKDFAQLLLDCLGLQINTHIPNGLSCGYMVGGRDEDGNVVANELTDLCLQVIDDVRLVYPAVGLCYTDEMPDRYLQKACDLLTRGYSHPAIFNDDVITAGLRAYGVPEEQAHNYIHSTCVEITPVAASNVWVASPYTNLAQLLLDILDREYTSFDELFSRYLTTLDTRIRDNFEEFEKRRGVRIRRSMNPLLSCFVNDCLARGLDVERGGALYNWTMPSFVGMANVVDSLFAIKQAVFEDHLLTFAELKTILDNDFEGHEDLRLYLLNRIPKYGNDNDEIDALFKTVADHLANEFRQYHGVLRNGQYVPSVFCWVMHASFGRETGATPDGRKAAFPLGDGSGPCQGREQNGPTASILSSTKWDHAPFIGGVAVNLKFSKTSLGSAPNTVLPSLVKTYLSRGGFEVQINVVDNETLKRAQQHPEQYRDLVVRIGGYSDYFVRLSDHMQREVLLRTAHHV